MAKILLTGGSGLLAVNWAIQRRSTDEVHLLLNRREIAVDGTTAHKIDLTDTAALKAFVKEVKPDLVVHTAGLTDVDRCEAEPDTSKVANVEVARYTAEACKEIGTRLVHISTDHLFDGKNHLATENTPVAPLNEYGRHKAEAEAAVLEAHPDAIVARTTFFGWGTSYRQSFSDILLKALDAGDDVTAFDDVFFTPLSTRRLVELVHAVVEAGHNGLIHIAGGERISKYEFSTRLAKAFGHDPDLIQPVQASRSRSTVSRPLDLSLSAEKMQSLLGIGSVSVDEVVADLKMDEEWKPEIRRIGRTIPYGRHYVDNGDIDAVVKTLKSGFLTQGPMIPAFEERIANYVGAKYAVAVSSATAGLHLSYKALGLGPRHSVLTSPITFVSTANAAVFCGGVVRFADIDPSTVNLGADAVGQALNEHGDIAIVAPVLFGGAADGIPEVAEKARKAGRKIVEDAAHGLGASYSCGSMVGSCKYSDCTVFSLHPVKSIAAGEGGIITTNDEGIYRQLLRLRSHGINKNDDPFIATENAMTYGEVNPWYYEMQEIGYHYRITDIQLSLAMSQMEKLGNFLERRRELVKRYRKWCKGLPYLDHAQAIDVAHSANHLFVGRFDFKAMGHTRSSLMKALRERGIITQVHYIPVVIQPYYTDLGHDISDYPTAKTYYDSALSLPLYYSLTDEEHSFVMDAVERCLSNG